MKSFKNLTVTSGVIAALSMGAVGCSNKNNEDEGRVSVTAQATMDSEELALAGEQLVSPYTFMLADKVFDMALAKDPANYRARFYKAFLKPAMAMKGAYKRVRPFVEAHGNINQYDTVMADVPVSPLRSFLLEGPEDVRTVSDIQGFIDQYQNGLSELYDFLKENEKVQLTINLNPNVFQQQLTKEAMDDCTVVTNDTHAVRVDCNYRNLLTRKIGLADMIALRQSVAGMVLYTMLYNSYSLEGIEVGGTSSEVQSTEEALRKLESMPKFGLLRPSHKFASLRKFGADASAAWKYVRAHQGALCPSTKYPFQKRRKGYLYSDGVCLGGVSSEEQKSIALLDQALAGPISVLAERPDGTKTQLVVNPMALSANPIADLRSIMPATYNACGQATSFRDPSFGGLLPNGDGNNHINASCGK